MALETVVRKRQLPDYTMYMETTTTGMSVTCRIIEDRGSFTITREMYVTHKAKPHWLKNIETFFKLACEHYPERTNLGLVKNPNKQGSI